MSLATKPFIGVALVIVGALLLLAGAVLYVLPGPGFPVLALGLATLIIGFFVIAALRRK
ncbi:hypothetical protein GCM10010269_15830 [Streptomyces humidus]|uniref:Uncharacterized protein n=1 Tax=Streptomyces humidus TaxID=52259 RepID=A0A918FSL4_9ACTN|nr:hypothetical protein [Streptomyces humidus]GGR77410.1 hypothetical protein GCM10010269_15830 [Streptomyces humidus]